MRRPDRLPQHIQTSDLAVFSVTGKQGGQRDLDLHLGRQDTAVDTVCIQLSLGVIVGVAGVERIRIRLKTHQVPQIEHPLRADVPALPHAHISAMVEGSFPPPARLDDKPGHIRGIFCRRHGGEVILVGIHPCILHQGSPVRKTVPRGTADSICSGIDRQVAVSRGIQENFCVKPDDAAIPRCQRAANPPALSLLAADSPIAELPVKDLHPGLQAQPLQHPCPHTRMKVVGIAPDPWLSGKPQLFHVSVSLPVDLPHRPVPVPEPVGADTAHRGCPAKGILLFDKHCLCASPGSVQRRQRACRPAACDQHITALLPHRSPDFLCPLRQCDPPVP